MFYRVTSWSLLLALCVSTTALAKDKELHPDMKLAVTASALSAEQSDRSVVGPGDAASPLRQAAMATVVRDGTMLGLSDAAASAPPAESVAPVVAVEAEGVVGPVDATVSVAAPVPPAAPAVPPLPAPGLYSDPGLTAALMGLTRSIDEQRMMHQVEARLADKQRIIDRLQVDVDRRLYGVAAPVAPPAGDPATDPPPLASKTVSAAAPAPAVPRSPAQAAAMVQERSEPSQAPVSPVAASGAPDAATQAILDRLDAQQTLLQKLQAQSDAPAPTGPVAPTPAQVAAAAASRPPVVAPTSSGSASDEARRQTVDAERAAMEAELQALKDTQWKLQYQLENGSKTAAPPPVVASSSPTSAAAPQDPEVAALRARLQALEAERNIDQATSERDRQIAQLQAQLAVTGVAAPANNAGDSQEIEALRAELEALRQSTSQPATETEALRDAVLATEADRSRLESLAKQMETLQQERAVLAGELETADEVRKAELDAEREANAARTAALESELGRLQGRTEEMEKLYTNRYESVLAQLQPLIDSGLEVRVVAGKIKVELPSDVLFASGSATLSRKGREEVQRVAAALRPFRTMLVQVEGHTDSVPVKSFKYESNYDLAFARAKDVMGVMLEAGLGSDRVSAASFGDTRPIAPNDNRDNRARNRRIDLKLELIPEDSP